MASTNGSRRDKALSLLFGLAPFAFGTFRALSARYDVRMLWMAAASGAGALAIRTLVGRGSERGASAKFVSLTLVVTTLLGGVTAMFLGATAPAGIWPVAVVLALCWTASNYFAARSHGITLMDPSQHTVNPGFQVQILERGRDGHVRYSEGLHHYDFYWELCGAGCVVSASVPSVSKWPHELPWAADRRDEVVARVGEAMCRHSGAGHTWRLNNDWLEVL